MQLTVINSYANYSAWSSKDGPPEAIQEKVMSIPDHMAGIHVFENNQHYKQCAHPIPLPGRKYIAKNSLARQKVKEILMGVNDQRFKDYLLIDEYQGADFKINKTTKQLNNFSSTNMK